MNFYTLKEVAEQLSVSYRTLQRELKKGVLKTTKVGRMHLITEKQLQDYLTQRLEIQPLRVAVAVVEKENLVAIVKRRYGEGKLVWQFPAGTQAFGEESDITAIRELNEETGIKAVAIKRIGSRIHPQSKAFMTYWLCEYISGDIRNLDTDENEEAKWVTRKEALEHFTSNVFAPLEQYLLEE